jgi:hypothetical protein
LEHPKRAIFLRIVFTAAGANSTKSTHFAPRERASKPKEPVPAKGLKLYILDSFETH